MHYPKQSTGGFALVVSVVLTAFLVLILVALASLVRVETQVASNTQQLQQARQNALFGLQIALGQLQKYTGPDQRVTARSDLTATAINPYYTGVWDASAASTAVGDARTRTADLENAGRLKPLVPSVWLVSGNETDPTAFNQATPSTTMREPVTLVKATAPGASGQVVVSKVEITSDQVPGYSDPQPVGNYAYWVGDEGVKAKLNVVDPYTPRPAIANAAAFTPTSLQSYYRGVSAQRFGVEAVEDATSASRQLSVLYKPTANTADSATLLLNLNKVIHYPAASLAGLDQATLSDRFHDLTVSSIGLLTNTAAGGLRRDLSWHFTQPDAIDGLDKTSLLYLPEQAKYVPGSIYKDAIPNSINPKWQALKAFYNTAVTDGASAVVLPNPANTTNPILPLLLQARFFFGCHSNATGTNLDTYVAFVLANPYNVTLNVNPVRFKFKLRNPGKITITVKPGTQAAVVRDLMGTSPAPLNGTFLTPSFTIAPGKVKVFSLAADTAPGTPDALLMDGLDINNAVSVPLSPTPFIPSNTNKWQLNFKLPLGYTLNDIEYTLVATDKFTEDAALASNPSATEKAEEMAALFFSGYVRLHSGMLTVPSGPDRTVTGSSNPWVANGFITTLKMSSENGVPSTEQIRWLQDFNIRTSRQMRPNNNAANPLYVTLYWNTGTSFSSDLASGDPSWGTAVSDGVGKTPVILYNLPRPLSGAASGWPSILSLGQLQHANLSTRAWQPSYLIGNSYASLFTQRDKTITQVAVGNVNRDDKYYDLSYLINEALWDGYFFSSIPQTVGTFNSGTDKLPNSRYFPRTRSDGSLPTQSEMISDSYAAASHLFVNGAFNINSTSVQAWRALFTSFRGLSYNGETNLSGPFPRSPYQSGGSPGAQTVTNDHAWSGFRNLTNTEINNLAKEMVNQVRLRGPFRSLGDFVNRRLMDSGADPDKLGLRGALQAAIDAATVGINNGFNDNVNSSAYNSATAFPDLNPSNVEGSRSLGAPGWLLQGDLLQGLGPILSARSDTFIIRAYGDSAGPVSTANGTTPPRAYCEAVVQRIPEYVDTSNAITSTTLTTINNNFGRRFMITQFRWLTESDL